MDGSIPIRGKASAVCNMVLDTEGGLITGVADMGITVLNYWKAR